MLKLTKKEEEIMQIIWRLNQAFIKEIVASLPEPKPHYNTVSTIVKILEDKGFVTHKKFGNVKQFQPVVSKDSYQTEAVDDIIEKYFDSSYKNLIAHFADKEKINESELKEILKLIQSKKS